MVGYPPQYLAAQVITKEWVQPIDAPHKQFKASSDVTDAAGNVMVTAYAVERPDGQWSVMLVNRDQFNDHAVKVAFAGGRQERSLLSPARSTASRSAPTNISGTAKAPADTPTRTALPRNRR